MARSKRSSEDRIISQINKIRIRVKKPKDFTYPIPILEFIYRVGGSGLGLHRRYASREFVILPSGKRVLVPERDEWLTIERPNLAFLGNHKKFGHIVVYVRGSRVKPRERGNEPTRMPEDINVKLVRKTGKVIDRKAGEIESVVKKLMERFRQAKTQKNLVPVALGVGINTGLLRGWKKFFMGTEVSVFLPVNTHKHGKEKRREIGSRDFFMFGRVDGEYEGVSVEVQSQFTMQSLKKVFYSLVESVEVRHKDIGQIPVRLVEHYIVVPKDGLSECVKSLLKLKEWEKVTHDVDGLFDPEYVIERMKVDSDYALSTLTRIAKESRHRKLLTSNDRKLVEYVGNLIKQGNPVKKGHWENLERVLEKIREANEDRLTINFNIGPEVVDYVLGKTVRIGGKKIKPKYHEILQHNTLLYFFARGFKDDIKKNVMKELDKDRNKKVLSGKADVYSLDINPVVMGSVLNSMAGHIRKSLERTKLVLVGRDGGVESIVYFKRVPKKYKLYPVVVTYRNKEKLAFREGLLETAKRIDRRLGDS